MAALKALLASFPWELIMCPQIVLWGMWGQPLFCLHISRFPAQVLVDPHCLLIIDPQWKEMASAWSPLQVWFGSWASLRFAQTWWTRLSGLQSEILSVSFLWNFPYWGWCHFQRTNVLLAYYICYQTSFHLKHWEKMCFLSCRDVVLGEKFHAIEVQQTAVIWFRSNSLGQRHF